MQTPGPRALGNAYPPGSILPQPLVAAPKRRIFASLRPASPDSLMAEPNKGATVPSGLRGVV
jgi:hypothetical protein